VNKGNIYLSIHQGLIPRVHGTASYNREANLDKTFKHPFNKDTIMQANVVFELSRIIGLSVNYNWAKQLNDKKGKYEPINSFGITTVFTFF
jgi:hypothetical protein